MQAIAIFVYEGETPLGCCTLAPKITTTILKRKGALEFTPKNGHGVKPLLLAVFQKPPVICSRVQSDTGDANGSHSCSHTVPQNAKYVAGSTKAIKSSNPRIYIIGCGKEIGHNGRDVVKAYIKVTRDSLETKILN